MQKPSKSALLTELRREQADRRKRWQMYKEYDQYRFADLERQKQYDNIEFLILLLEHLPDQLFARQVQAITEREGQYTLFDL